jgi:hypothetical protein
MFLILSLIYVILRLILYILALNKYLNLKPTWRHKFTKEGVHRYKTKSGKSFDTGVLSGYLQSLGETTNKVAFERAKLILRLNGKKSRAVDAAKNDHTRVVNRKSLLIQWVSA